VAATIITPPQPIISAADAKAWAPVLAEDAEARIEALLAVAQAGIEPPLGWVGRAFGVQTLEVVFDRFRDPCLFLPYPPLRKVISVTYEGADGEQQEIAAADLRVLGLGTTTGSIAPKGSASWPAAARGPEAVRVRFEAGYDADDLRLAPARQAVVLAATHLRSLGSQDLALRSDEVEGIGTKTWTVSDVAQKLIQTTVDSLLAPYKVWAL